MRPPSTSSLRNTNTNPPEQCANYQIYEIVQLCFNVPGDIVLLAVAIPILSSIRIPLQQKAVLLIIFGMGSFVIVCAILTKIYCLVPNLISYVYMRWYFREASVAMYVSNLPTIWPLFRDLFPGIVVWGSRSLSKPTALAHSAHPAKHHHRRASSLAFARSRHHPYDTANSLSDSQEPIHEAELEDAVAFDHKMDIRRDISFSVQSHDVTQDLPPPPPAGDIRRDVSFSVQSQELPPPFR